MNKTENSSVAPGADFLRHDTAPAAAGVEGYLEHDAAVYRTLLESTKAIPWKVDWANHGTQLYHAKDNGRDCIAAINRVA
ncbi:hypothetical protein [Paraburkholderia fungorum]|uniref:hypothetical protein n=1 Tax=Paraburkholderia fungorum TaxID=134537 RepID=UPI0038B762F5